MGCGASAPGYGRRDDASSVAPLCNEESRMLREIESLEFISDADTVEEPSSCKKSVQVAAKCFVARVAHGITDDVTQFEAGMREMEPVFEYYEFNFMREWMDEIRAILGSETPEPLPDHGTALGARPSTNSATTQPFRPMASSRTTAARVTVLQPTTPTTAQRAAPAPPPTQQRSAGLHSVPSPQTREFTVTSPGTQSTSVLGATGEFVLDTTSSNAHQNATCDPLLTSVATHLHRQQEHSLNAAKYINDGAPFEKDPAAPGAVGRIATNPKIMRSGRTQQPEEYPGQVATAA